MNKTRAPVSHKNKPVGGKDAIFKFDQKKQKNKKIPTP